jgi:pimeloyl-ACP methyl ester carboxylesterase
LPLIEELALEWRVLAPDFIGYGQSDAWPENQLFTGQADLAVLLELAKKTKRPIHLVGHSYGAALALEAARELGPKAQSLTLVEPVSFNLLRVERRPEWTEVERLALAALSAVSRGNEREAAAAFMRYWLGRLRWWLSPEKFKAAITATIRKVALEFTITIEAGTRLSDYTSVTTPTLLVVGGKTRAPARAVVDMHAEHDATERHREGAQRREPYEPLHPSFRGEPADRRLSRRSAPMSAVSSSGS